MGSEENDLHLAAYERTLRSRNRSTRTIQSYRESLEQLSDFHEGTDFMDLARSDIEEYLDALLEEYKATTAGVRFRALRAFYNWAVDEEILTSSPMRKMEAPSVEEKPVPVLPDSDLKALLKACSGKEFDDRRDTAILRLWCEPGSPRVAEMANIRIGGDDPDVDMRRDQIRILGKGNKIRIVPFGAKTGQALDRYLRVRAKHPKASLPHLWLGARGMELTVSGLAQMLRRRSTEAGIGHVHPHQLRHTAAHQWKLNSGSEEDAMALFGWSSPDMPRRYGASARVDRAQQAARRMSQADRL